MDNADNFYGELANCFRDMGSRDNPETLYIGQVKKWDWDNKKFEIEIDGLVLDEEDFYISSYLYRGYQFPLETSYVSEVYFGSETTKKQSTAIYKEWRNKWIKKGDLLAVMKCNDNDTYVILEKVVKP